jgi:type VI secretion system protein ImpJ
MTLVSKPLWSQGMLIRPQHFQQYDRWIEHVLEGRSAGMTAFGWGLRSLTLASELLPLGRIGIAGIRAVMPDGTVLDETSHAAFEARSVPPNLKNVLVKVALAVRALDGAEIGAEGRRRRYDEVEQPMRDTTAPERGSVALRVARLSPRLLIEGEPEDDVITMPVARIREVDAAGAILLDENYVPPCLNFHASPRLLRIVNEVRALLRSRAEALAGNSDPAQATAESGGLVDLLILSIVNGQEAIFDHFAATPGLHPETVYRASLALAGQLSTFTSARRRSGDFPAYQHLDLDAAFAPVLDQLRQLLATLVERNAVALPLQDRGYGIRLSTIADRTLFQDGRFVLIATASMPTESLRSQLPIAMKVGSVEQIRDLVNLQLPGIPLRALPVAPRELPFLQGGVYFELDQSVELWRNLTRSAAVALHVSGDYADLHLEFWAIRGKKA